MGLFARFPHCLSLPLLPSAHAEGRRGTVSANHYVKPRTCFQHFCLCHDHRFWNHYVMSWLVILPWEHRVLSLPTFLVFFCNCLSLDVGSVYECLIMKLQPACYLCPRTEPCGQRNISLLFCLKIAVSVLSKRLSFFLWSLYPNVMRPMWW